MTRSFLGFVREDGSIGVRNHVLILPLAASLAPVAANIAAQAGAVCVGHEFERASSDSERDRVARTLAGTASHPNVDICVALGDSSLEPQLLEILAQLQRVTVLDVAVLRSRARIADEALRYLKTHHRPASREPVPISELVVGTECGGSDAWSGITANPALGVASDLLVDQGATVVLAETPELIGAEHLLAARATTNLRERLLSTITRYEQALIDVGEDIRGAQPTVGNMAGGLTTIEEKSLGAAKKAGSRAITSVIEYAEPVPTRQGVVLMDTPGHDIEQMTGMIAGGAQIVVFTTGRGTPTGSALAPVIKVASNTAVFERLRADIDLDAGKILHGASLEAIGSEIFELIISTASGEMTSAERRDANDFALSRFSWSRALESSQS